MIKSKITEGNLLIAKFMGLKKAEPKGWTIDKKGNDDYDMTFPLSCKFWGGSRLNQRTTRNSVLCYHLAFNSNWNWLMEAWFKFQKSYNKQYRTNQIRDTIFWGNFREGILNAKISTCFTALVEGIEWYNKYNKIKNGKEKN